MPQIVVYAALTIGYSTTMAILQGVAAMALSFAMSAITRPKIPDMTSGLNTAAGSPLEAESNKRMQVVRGTVEPKRTIYGNVAVGGTMNFVDSKDLFGRGQNEFMYMGVVIAPHKLSSINGVIYDNVPFDEVKADYYDSPTDSNGQLWKNGFEIHFLEHNSPDMRMSLDIDGVSTGYLPIWDGANDSITNRLEAAGFGTALYISDRVRSYEYEYLNPATDEDAIRNHARMLFVYQGDSIFNTADVPTADLIKSDALAKNGLTHTYFPKFDGVSSFATISVLNEEVLQDDDSINPYYYINTDDGLGNLSKHYAKVYEVAGNYYSFSWNGSSYDTVTHTRNPTVYYEEDTAISSLPQTRVTNATIQIGSFAAYRCDETNKPAVLVSNFHTGEQTSIDPMLSGFPYWDGIGYGQSYAVLRWFYDYERLPNGVPNIRFNVSGKPLYSPVYDDEIYSNNAALVILDYLRSTNGLNLSDSEIDFDSFKEAEKLCDRIIDVSTAKTYTFNSAYSTWLNGDQLKITIADHGFSGTGTIDVNLQDGTIAKNVKFVALDKDTILLQRQIDTSIAQTGTATVKQKMYTIDGSVVTNSRPSDVLNAMLVNIGYGKLVFDNGKFKIKPGVKYEIFDDGGTDKVRHLITDTEYSTPYELLTIDESWLAGDITATPFSSRNNIFNAVKGTFLGNETTDYQVSAFGAIKNASYCAQDSGGDVCTTDSQYIYKSVQYHYVTDEIRAQRLAKILLNQARQAFTLNVTCNMKAYILDIDDVVRVSIEHLGLNNKEFRVEHWSFTPEGGINLTLIETSADIWDWNVGDENVGDLAQNSELQNQSFTPDLNSITVTSQAEFTVDRQLKEVFFVTVDGDSAYPFYIDTEVQYRKVNTTDNTWKQATKGTGDVFKITDVELGTYVVRARKLSKVSAPTQWIYETHTAQGAGALITEVSLPKPINPLLFFSVTDNRIDKMRVTIDYNPAQWSDIPVPEFAVLMYSGEEYANKLTLADNNLVVSDAEVLNNFETPVLADASNSVTQIKVSATAMDTELDLVGMWWIRLRRADGTTYSKFVKVDRYDEYYIYLARAIEFTPIDTDTIEVYEVAFHDIRQDPWKLGVIQSGGDYEVIGWEDLQYNGTNFQFVNVTRQAEQSASIDATGKEFSYYPAMGAGSSILTIPASQFNSSDGDTVQATFELDTQLPDRLNWAAVTVMFGSMTQKAHPDYPDDASRAIPVLVRSPIVPLNYGGER